MDEQFRLKIKVDGVIKAILMTSLQVKVVIHLLQMQLCILALRLPSLLRFLLRITNFLEKSTISFIL